MGFQWEVASHPSVIVDAGRGTLRFDSQAKQELNEAGFVQLGKDVKGSKRRLGIRPCNDEDPGPKAKITWGQSNGTTSIKSRLSALNIDIKDVGGRHDLLATEDNGERVWYIEY
jgi:hypothetical protein